jgi:hypothetical protein
MCSAIFFSLPFFLSLSLSLFLFLLFLSPVFFRCLSIVYTFSHKSDIEQSLFHSFFFFFLFFIPTMTFIVEYRSILSIEHCSNGKQLIQLRVVLYIYSKRQEEEIIKRIDLLRFCLHLNINSCVRSFYETRERKKTTTTTTTTKLIVTSSPLRLLLLLLLFVCSLHCGLLVLIFSVRPCL